MRLVTLKATNMELKDMIKIYLEKKFGPLEKFLQEFGAPHNLYVELAKTTKHHKTGPYFYAEADVVAPKAHLRAEATAEDLYAAIDILRDEIKRQILELKEKRRAKAKKEQRNIRD